MIPGLQPISLQDLKALAAPRHWSIEGHLDEMSSLTPLRGSISAEHQGSILEVKGKFQTIVTLCCDRCLSEFNQNLACNTEELIWLKGDGPNPNELNGSSHSDDMDALMECLDPRGSFDPERWVFEQLSLQMPLVKRCGADCPGPAQLQPSAKTTAVKAEGTDIDPRWAALQKLNSL